MRKNLNVFLVVRLIEELFGIVFVYVVEMNFWWFLCFVFLKNVSFEVYLILKIFFFEKIGIVIIIMKSIE